MVARLRSWWKNTSKTLDAVIISSLVILLILLVLVILGYANNWPWTGLHGRTLYDWLQLLIIPAVLALGGYLFNYTTGRTEREIASDRQQEEALQAYIDSMSALLLDKNLRESGENDEVRTIARVRTLTVLPRLDGKRKASVLQFLHESGLIKKGAKIVDLNEANLLKVDLFLADLSKADLRGASLRGANLHLADLNNAELSGTGLLRANLNGANLTEANLSVGYLKEANLVGANLTKANLTETNLLGANLSRANLSEANLNKTILNGANLTEAVLSKADLTEAYLQRADLTKAKVTTNQLDKAFSLKGATMPNGTKHA